MCLPSIRCGPVFLCCAWVALVRSQRKGTDLTGCWQVPRGAGSSVSLLDRIEATCRSNVQLPRGLRDRPEFGFLKSKRG